MSEPSDKKKNLSFITKELRIDRNINVKMKTVDITKPHVIEINLSFFAIPKKNKTIEEYTKSITTIERKYKRMCWKYTKENPFIIDKFISDFNFTPANLKRGYNKHVTMSLYVKQNKLRDFMTITKELKKELRNHLKSLVLNIKDEEFICSKKKKK